MKRRTLLSAGLWALASACTQPQITPVPDPRRLRLIGEVRLPHRMSFLGTTVGGLSALDYDPQSGLWYALSDDRSDVQPARFYTLRMALDGAAVAAPEFLNITLLRQQGGAIYPGRRQGGVVPDPEGLRLVPGKSTLVWSSEGDRERGLPTFIHEIRSDGSYVRNFKLPPELLQTEPEGWGTRDNLCLEGLAFTPGGATLWAAMEAPLHQDGSLPTLSATGGPCRITEFDTATGEPLRQIAYEPEPIARAPRTPLGFSDNGISEILMLDQYQMLVLERSYSLGRGNTVRLYQIDTRIASNTLGLARLTLGNYHSAPKTLVADFSQFGLAQLDNLEGLCWGPTLEGGRRTLVLVSDDNFNPMQITQILAFEWIQ